MKILSLNYEFPPLGGGAGYVSKAINETLTRKGISVDFITMHYDGLKYEEVINGVRIFRVKSFRKKQETCEVPEMLSFVVSAIPFALRLTKKNTYTLVHSHFVIPTSIVAYILKKARRLDYIISAHGSDIPGYNPDRFTFEHRFTRPLLTLLMRNAKTIVPLSNYLKGLIEKNISPDFPSVVIPNGIEPDAFRGGLARNNWILMSGRFLKRKGFQYVLQALEKADLAAWEVHLAGDGPYRGELERLANRCGLKTVFHGWLAKDSPELKGLYMCSKIFVLPSDVENAPISLLEAMNAGLAIITTNIPACKEIAGDAAEFVSPHDAAGIKESLLGLVRDKNKIKEMGEKARKRSIEHFSWDGIVDRYIELYKKAAQK